MADQQPTIPIPAQYIAWAFIIAQRTDPDVLNDLREIRREAWNDKRLQDWERAIAANTIGILEERVSRRPPI